MSESASGYDLVTMGLVSGSCYILFVLKRWQLVWLFTCSKGDVEGFPHSKNLHWLVGLLILSKAGRNISCWSSKVQEAVSLKAPGQILNRYDMNQYETIHNSRLAPPSCHVAHHSVRRKSNCFRNHLGSQGEENK